jgi:hypothetical protein
MRKNPISSGASVALCAQFLNITLEVFVRAHTIAAHGGLEKLEYRTDLPRSRSLGGTGPRPRNGCGASITSIYTCSRDCQV